MQSREGFDVVNKPEKERSLVDRTLRVGMTSDGVTNTGQSATLNSIKQTFTTRSITQLFGMFKTSNKDKDSKNATNLLSDIKKFNFDAMERKIKKNPGLMFIQVMDDDNQYISPLQYALKTLNSWVWKIMYERIINDNELVNLFITQANQQREYINLDELLAAYKAYIDLVNANSKSSNVLIMSPSLNAAWLEIGKQQRLIPRHMLYELLCGLNSWSNTTDFGIGSSSIAHLVLSRGNMQCFKCDLTVINVDEKLMSQLGSTVALFRAVSLDNEEHNKRCKVTSIQPVNVLYDGEIFRRLYETRRNELDAMMKMLNQNCPQSDKLLRC